MQVLLLQTIKDESGETDFELPANTVLNVLSHEEGAGHWICWLHPDNARETELTPVELANAPCFPINYDEAVEIIVPGSLYRQRTYEGESVFLEIESIKTYYNVEIQVTANGKPDNFDWQHDQLLSDLTPHGEEAAEVIYKIVSAQQADILNAFGYKQEQRRVQDSHFA